MTGSAAGQPRECCGGGEKSHGRCKQQLERRNKPQHPRRLAKSLSRLRDASRMRDTSEIYYLHVEALDVVSQKAVCRHGVDVSLVSSASIGMYLYHNQMRQTPARAF